MAYSSKPLDHFGHLYLSTGIARYGLSLAAAFAGLFELMLRDKAGIQTNAPTAQGPR